MPYCIPDACSPCFLQDFTIVKLSIKSSKDNIGTPLFGPIGDAISKNKKKKYIGLQQGMILGLTVDLVLNLICHVLSFLECFQPISIVIMCIVAINVLKLGSFNHESQYFIPLFNKISRLCV